MNNDYGWIETNQCLDAIETVEEAVKLARFILNSADFMLETPLDRAQYDVMRQVKGAAQRLLIWFETGDEDTEAPFLGGMTAEPEASELVPEPEATGWSVLVVEDNVFTQKLMLRWLEARGCTARVAGHGQEALEMLTHEGTRATVDLVLLDLCMPVMDGLVMAQQLRAAERLHNWMRMPLLAVTALTGDEERQRALEAGIDGFHSKPIQSDALFTEMTRLMSERDGTSPEDEEARHGVDVAYALRVMEGDWELFQEVVGLYLTDAPKHIERMREAVYAGDASALREAAHTLKGASSAFGKNSRVHELALTLEQIGRQGGDISRADPLCRDLVSAFELLRQGLQETLDGCVTE